MAHTWQKTKFYSGEVARAVDYYQGHFLFVKSLLINIAELVLSASLVTGWLFCFRKLKRLNAGMWNATSKQLPIIVDVPLCVGGFFTLVHVGYGYYNLVATSVLPLYGPLLINASSNFYEKVRYLGYSKLVAGASAAIFPGFGLHF
ncbi:MAG: hypothetical protein ACKODM_04825 [Cytophagales bacterium]